MFAVMEERMTDYLDAIDRAENAADFDELAAALIAVAAERGFKIEVTPRDIVIDCWPAGDRSMMRSAVQHTITAEILSDLITYFENSEEPMNIYSTDLFKYLSGDMIGQNTIVLTITKFTEEKMSAGGRGEQIKQCLHFKERDKTMVLNKTNANAIAKVLGPETDQWAGGRITLAAPVIDAFGQQRRAIRVIDVEPPDVPLKPRPTNGNS